MTDEPGLQRRCRAWFWAVLLGFTAFRLLIAGQFGLSTDESHYVLYSRRLAFGYFDHPPLVAFLGALTSLGGEGAWWYRLGPILCWSGSLVLLRRLILVLFGDERIALGAALLLPLVPVQHLLAVALLPDATLNLFWCAGLLAAWRALQDGRWRWWVLVGVCFGSALLSKYHGVLFPLCLFGYVVSARERRHWLWSPKPVVAGLVGMAVFLPNLIWNAQHDWISYAFQIGHGGGSGAFALSKLGKSLGGQLAAGSPLLFVLFLVAALRGVRATLTSDRSAFLWWTSLPVFAFFCGVGLSGKILPHWPAVAWWSGAALLAARCVGSPAPAGAWRRWTVAGAVVGAASLAAVYAAVARPLIPPLYEAARRTSERLARSFPYVPTLGHFLPEYDITNDLYGWEDAARRIGAVRAAMPRPERTFVFCHRFFTTSQLAVYLPPGADPAVLVKRPSQYRLWFNAREHGGWDALFVDDAHYRQDPARYATLFERVDREAVEVRVSRGGWPARDMRVFRCYGFRGKYEGE